METKLTLRLNHRIIERAKGYAKARKTSLSKMIENYLDNVTAEKGKKENITPLVRSLSGIIDLSKDYNHKKSYGDFLIDKYK